MTEKSGVIKIRYLKACPCLLLNNFNYQIYQSDLAVHTFLWLNLLTGKIYWHFLLLENIIIQRIYGFFP